MTDKFKMFKLAKNTHYRIYKTWMAVCSLLVVASVGIALNTSSEVKAAGYVDPSTAIATHGDPIKIAGKKYYGIGNDRYIKKVNFNKLPAPVRPGNVPGLLVNGKLRHNAYIYDETGKRTNKVILKYNSKIYAAVSEVITGRKFYEFGQGQRIAADNIDGTKRKLTHNACL